MAQPSRSMVHTDRAATNMTVAQVQQDTRFTFHRFFPNLPVDKKSGIYYTFNTFDWNRDELEEREPGTRAARGGFDMSTASYRCRRYDKAYEIPDEIRDEQDESVDIEKAHRTRATVQAMIKQERLFNSRYITTGVWGTDVAGGSDFTKFSDTANSDPFEVFDIARRQVELASAEELNVAWLGYDAHLVLKKHPLVIERVKYVNGSSFKLATEPAAVQYQALADAFELDEWIVSKATYTSTEEGIAAGSQAMAFAGTSTSILLAHKAPAPGLMIQSAGYIFSRKGFGDNALGIRVKQLWHDDDREQDVGEVAFNRDFKVVSPSCGYYMATAVATQT